MFLYKSIILWLFAALLSSCGADFEKHWPALYKIRKARSFEQEKRLTVPNEYLLTVDGEAFGLEGLPDSSTKIILAEGLSLPLESFSVVTGYFSGKKYRYILRARVTDSDTLEGLSLDARVLHGEPNWLNKPDTVQDSFATLSLTYQRAMQDAYWLDQIRLGQAFSSMQDILRPVTSRPIVAVMDSGVDVSHAALTGQVVDLSGYDTGCKDGQNGCNVTRSFGVHGFGDGSVYPYGTGGFDRRCFKRVSGHVCPHGTLVAGIIAANPQFGYGGICPDCLILPIKVVEESGADSGAILDSSIAAGISYLLHLKEKGVDVRVLNASFGKFRRSLTVTLLLNELAKKGKGTLIIAAAGNENTDKPQYPAALESVVSVANVDSISGIKHQTSNYGSWVDISAPGSGLCGGISGSEGILSSVPGGGAACAPGTSFSAPMVSGVAGLLLSREPSLTAGALKRRLLDTASGAFYGQKENAFYAGQLGSGIVDAYQAVSLKGEISPYSSSKTREIRNGCGVLSFPAAGQYGFLWFLLPIVGLFVRPLFTTFFRFSKFSRL